MVPAPSCADDDHGHLGGMHPDGDPGPCDPGDGLYDDGPYDDGPYDDGPYDEPPFDPSLFAGRGPAHPTTSATRSDEDDEAALAGLWDRATAGLNPAQHEAVTTLDGPLLVVAGPGSGKTRVLTHRIAALVASGVDPRSILAITFTNKAADEMRTRLVGLLGDVVDEGALARMWVSTFHSACARILREHATLAGRTPRYGIADSDDSRRILSRLLATAGIADQARDIHSQISLAKNKMLSPAGLSGPQWHPQLSHWFRLYQEALAEQDLFDFDDLLLYSLGVLAKNPEVAQAYRRRFTHVLVDEFQDTNAVQYQLLVHLGAHGDICVVGDHNQAVYGFRGATPSVLASFERDWPATRVVVLGENYRSTPEIVAVSQAVIDQHPSPRRTELSTSNPSGVPVRLVVCERDLDEARLVAREVATDPAGPGAHAVIYRTNAQSRVLEQAMRDSGVPYRIVGGVSFFDHAEVRDAMAWLRAAMNPLDREALRRSAACPRRGVGEGTLDNLFAAADELGCAPLDVLELGADRLTTRARNTLGTLATDLATVRAAVDVGPDDAVDAVLGLDGFVEAATTRDGRDNAEQRRENLRELAASARSFLQGSSMAWPLELLADLDGPGRCDAFVANAALLSGGEDDEEVACVQLMTAHAAKGREFDAVHVTGVEDGFFPHSSAAADEHDEELRLLFVAVSRARQRLTLTRALTRFRFRDIEYRDPSPFLPGLRELVVETSDGTVARGRGNWPGDRPWLRRRGEGTAPAARPAPAAPQVAPGPRVDPSALAPGTVVEHTLYGRGTVERCDAEVAHVRFASGLRVMMLDAAPMHVVDPGAAPAG